MILVLLWCVAAAIVIPAAFEHRRTAAAAHARKSAGRSDAALWAYVRGARSDLPERGVFRPVSDACARIPRPAPAGYYADRHIDPENVRPSVGGDAATPTLIPQGTFKASTREPYW